MQRSLTVLYQAEGYPVFQNRMYATAKEARDCPKGDIQLVEDQQTGLVFNASFRPELVNYDSFYQNEQAVSPLFRKHLESVSRIIGQHLGRSALIEVGCGKAYFLEMLSQQGYNITGFDPTYEGRSPLVRKEYFREGCGIHAQGLILRRVLEHIAEPIAFLETLKQANAGVGRIYIEVPCFDWICKKRAWFDIFYEHVNYFRLSDLKRMFDRVIDSGVLFGGQYLYVVAELGSLRVPQFDPNDAVRFPPDFTASLIPSGKQAEQAACVWGGASKGVIFSLLRERAAYPVSTVIDVNPAKQGKHLPGTGLKVESPDDALSRLPAGSPIYVMNSNYLEEIREMSGDAYNYIEVDR